MSVKDKIEKVVSEFKKGTLKDSAGNIVTDRRQAIAIAMSEAKSVSKSKKLEEALKAKIEAFDGKDEKVKISLIAEAMDSDMEHLLPDDWIKDYDDEEDDSEDNEENNNDSGDNNSNDNDSEDDEEYDDEKSDKRKKIKKSYTAIDVLAIKAKDYGKLVKKVITDKNGKRRSVWVDTSVSISGKGSHPSKEHSMGMDMYNKAKKYVSKENARAKVERHFGKDIADYVYSGGKSNTDKKNIKTNIKGSNKIAGKIGLKASDISEGLIHPSNISEVLDAWKNTNPLPIGTEIRIGKMKGSIIGYSSSRVFDTGSNKNWQVPLYKVKYGKNTGVIAIDDKKLALPEGSDRSYMNGGMTQPINDIGGGYFKSDASSLLENQAKIDKDWDSKNGVKYRVMENMREEREADKLTPNEEKALIAMEKEYDEYKKSSKKDMVNKAFDYINGDPILGAIIKSRIALSKFQ